MRVELAEGSGFCFGVKRAIQMAFEVAEGEPDPFYTLGPIIHNPQMVTRLEEKGIRMIAHPEEGDPGMLIVRSHGVAPEVIQAAERHGHRIVDATCPFVKRAQNYVKQLKEDGYSLVIVGKKDHAEVEGLLGYAEGDAVIIWDEEDLKQLGQLDRVGVVAQTTIPFQRFEEVIRGLLRKTRQLKVCNTICSSSEERQHKTLELAGKADVMIIVGGRNSANTSRLTELCRALGKSTYHIETAEELSPEWMERCSLVGVSAGASTPNWLIEEVMTRLNRWAQA
ncbi:MAG: 4-hydroxy-3-methylbut-2-enyl diphosphate reductase [Candidatus Latescibacterota bacterium]